ncbi:MAG: HAD-IA family hydrolase [Prevotella sp.]|nr:HAD-IA family hydrolase [Prevotella sp.]
MKKILILDFDGTLADTRGLIVKTMQQTIAEMQLPERTDEECAAMIGLPLSKTFTTLLPIDAETGARCAETYRRVFDENNQPGVVPLFPNVAETLKELHQQGVTITIASSRSRASLMGFVEEFGFVDLVSLVLGADDVKEAKPHPEPVLQTLRQMGFEPEEAIVVGDTWYDIEMGRRAGAKTVGVTFGNGTREQMLEHGADYIVDDFAQLKDVVFSE